MLAARSITDSGRIIDLELHNEEREGCRRIGGPGMFLGPTLDDLLFAPVVIWQRPGES
jgi:hypothetical protein